MKWRTVARMYGPRLMVLNSFSPTLQGKREPSHNTTATPPFFPFHKKPMNTLVRGATRLVPFVGKNTQVRYASHLVGKDISAGSYVLTDSQGNPHPPSIFKGRKVVLVGTANTPVCANYTLPSFVNNNEAIYSAGIDNIICIGATDPFTLRSWELSWDTEKELTHLASVDSQFLRWLNLIDAEKAQLEAKQFTLIVEDGIVKHENYEKSHDDFTVTDAGTILKQLGKSLPPRSSHH